MPQLHRRSSFSKEPLLSLGAAQERRRDDLQRHLAVQTGIQGLVSHAQTAAAKLDVLALVILR